jgi:molybdenum cofactor cytidylyltransferase
MTFTGILLAAGRGKRFDPAGRHNKLLQTLPDGELVVAASARHLLAAVPRVLAVVRPGDEQVAAALRSLGCEVHVCPDADSGMAASLTYAIGLTPASSGWLIALGDMPYVQPDTMRALVQVIGQGAHIAAPVYEGQRGNPVAFSACHLERLLALEGDQGARLILKNHSVNEVPVSDNGILRDIDTPADL